MSQKLLNLRYLLGKCGNDGNLVKQIHAQSIRLGIFDLHQVFSCKLLSAYSKLANPVEAQKVFSQIRNPDIISWTCLINLYIQIQSPCKAFCVFSEMVVSAGLEADGFSVVAALTACGRKKDFTSGRVVHGMVLRKQLGAEAIVGNALIDMYCRNGRVQLGKSVFDSMAFKDVASWTSLLNGFILSGDLESARQLFDEMPHRNVISWTAMIVGYVRGKNAVEALELFRRMRSETEVHPTEVTIVATLSGCADIGALDLGRSLHGYINKFDSLSSDVAVNSALIDMYTKSGSLDYAMRIFSEMQQKDLFSWTTIISGLAIHGEGKRALELFDDMMKSGLIPNDVTTLSALLACCHAGLVSEGKRLFDRLTHDYGFEPKIEHYGCMVDLLGRAGRLEEAIKLIEQMPMNPDAVIWRSLLSSCMSHGNFDLAEMAGKKVLELEPDDDGAHVLLWNIYCVANKWEQALKTRKLMRDQSIKKRPGCSWIEVNGVVHEFLAEDQVHQIHEYIYVVLHGIRMQTQFDSEPLVFLVS